MENAFAWLNKIFEYLWAIIPKPYLVSYTHRGVRYRRGQPPVLVKPGLRWYWPLTTTVKVINIRDHAEEFIPTELMTKDGKSITVGYSMVYRVADLVLADSAVDDYAQTMGELAETVLTPFVLNHTFEEVRAAAAQTSSRHSLNKNISRAIRQILKPYGIEVSWARIRTIAPVRVIKLHTQGR